MKKSHKILNINQLTTGYVQGRNTKTVSQGLNLDVFSGDFIALLGPNGSGKSTLLRTIASLQNHLSGSISINNTQIKNLKPKAKARLLSLVLTDRVETAYLSVKDIVGMGRYPHLGGMGILSQEDKKVVQNAMEQCRITSYQNAVYSELSDGEKQRVMLARALAQDTPLMMLDEPTAHLDLPNRVALMKTLRDLAHHNGKAILLSTHELDLALQWCDGIWLMNTSGDIVQGVPEDLVLNRSFSEVFSSDTFFFDIVSGTFKIKDEKLKTCYIEGEEIYREWTKRALERVGFQTIDTLQKADIHIQINASRKWILNHQEQSYTLTNIAELIDIILQLH